jgi:DNA-binding MarR family transcriptional regulator
VPRAFVSQDRDDLFAAERQVRSRFDDLDLDLHALAAVSNIFRAATAVRGHMERSVIGSHGLSWSGFVTVFVLHVWGDLESGELADEVGITSGTLTGVVKTLEVRGLVERRTHPTDGRRVIVSVTPEGSEMVRAIMPMFNRHEALVSSDLSPDEADDLAALLRRILRTVERLRDAR